MSILLIIEGTPKEVHGNLRQGFITLLRKVKGIKMPRIKMGNGVDDSIKKFKTSQHGGEKLLLIDLDNPISKKQLIIQNKSLHNQSNQVFFMVQEMEAWFLSQPQAIEKIMGRGVADKIPNWKDYHNISKPSEKLKKFSKGKYKKVKEATDLLMELDPNQLTKDFPDFAQLIKALG